MFNQNKDYYNSASSERLLQILKKDKLQMPQMIEQNLKKDMLKVIAGYLNLKDTNCDLRLEIENNGKILIAFEGIADSFKAKQ